MGVHTASLPLNREYKVDASTRALFFFFLQNQKNKKTMDIVANRTLLSCQVTAHELQVEINRRAAAGSPPLKGLIQSTPANPTGAMLTAFEVRACGEATSHNFVSSQCLWMRM
jgi:hypothetical protein